MKINIVNQITKKCVTKKKDKVKLFQLKNNIFVNSTIENPAFGQTRLS